MNKEPLYDQDETVIITLGELTKYFIQAANLGRKGFEIRGAGKIDGDLSVVVWADDKDQDDLLISANTK